MEISIKIPKSLVHRSICNIKCPLCNLRYPDGSLNNTECFFADLNRLDTSIPVNERGFAFFIVSRQQFFYPLNFTDALINTFTGALFIVAHDSQLKAVA